MKSLREAKISLNRMQPLRGSFVFRVTIKNLNRNE